jgi:Mg-chelatase subunit ChlD
MGDWIKRNFDAVGLTQAPPGPHLSTLQEPHVGKVLLCIDVSGSMSDRDGGQRTRLQRVVAGAERFVAEAVGANYRVGLVLWDHGVVSFQPLSRNPERVLRALREATIHGGTDILPTLRLGVEELGRLTGDRVMAVFGDGDIGPVRPATEMARHAAELGIRIVVRGLGDRSARELARIATEGHELTVIRNAGEIESGVAGMIKSVTGQRRKNS